MSTRKSSQSWEILLILLIILPVLRSERNVALSGSAVQSTNHLGNIWTADKAIDNCTIQVIGPAPHCCAHTAIGHNQAWWRVDLGQIITIQYITIYYRTGSGYRFAGYSLYVSNSTDYTQGILCYQDNSSLASDVNLSPTHLCPYVARYVTVYNYRGVPKRHDWYDDNAVLELCEVQVFGCPIGSYGYGNCDSPCSGSCYGGNCNAITGSCFYCFPGMFGDFCEKPCTPNCNNACQKDTGHCKVCVNGKYGEVCDQDCSDNCKDKTCMKDNGYCLECILGKHGNMCEWDCPDSCKDKNCMKRNGHCIVCNSGLYGSSCNQICSANCKDKICNQENGFCTACNVGKYGNFCDLACSSKCKNGKCKQIDGRCEACDQGTHGDYCSKTCPENCKNHSCLQEDGHCTGCEAGYYSDHCDRSCPSTCTTGVCDQGTGVCTAPAQPNKFETIAIGIGIGLGVVIVALVVLVILLVRRLRKHKGDNMNSTNMADLSQSVRREDLHSRKDETYNKIGPYTIEPPNQADATDDNYDHLDPLTREPAHVYENTKTAVFD